MTLTKQQYKQLLLDSEELSLLHASGVDNWEGYTSALYSDTNLIDLEKSLDNTLIFLPDILFSNDK